MLLPGAGFSPPISTAVPRLARLQMFVPEMLPSIGLAIPTQSWGLSFTATSSRNRLCSPLDQMNLSVSCGRPRTFGGQRLDLICVPLAWLTSLAQRPPQAVPSCEGTACVPPCFSRWTLNSWLRTWGSWSIGAMQLRRVCGAWPSMSWPPPCVPASPSSWPTVPDALICCE